MFEERTIPERKYKSCGMCPHYVNKLVKSGRNPERDHVCTHPSFEEKSSISTILNKGGKRIGKNNETPNWCPFLSFDKSKKRTFSEILTIECLEIVQMIQPVDLENQWRRWKIKKANKEVYEGGGYTVYSKHNIYHFDFDFEMETISKWDDQEDSDDYKFSMEQHYKIIQYLNSRNIFFSWQ